MDLKQLTVARQQFDTTVGSAHQEVSELSSIQGFCCLMAAEKKGYRDRELLKKAADAFALSIQYNRRNPDPYIGLAYLFVLVKDPQNAMPYLTEARALDPQNPDVQTLWQRLQEPTANTPSTEIDQDVAVDSLYEKLELMIQQHVQQFVHQHPVPSIEPQLFRLLQEQHSTLREICRTLQEQLQNVQTEVETAGLEDKLRPLFSHLKSFESALHVSQGYLRILKHIKEGEHEVENLSQQVKLTTDQQVVMTLENNVEVLLDRCDSIADQLDDYDQKGFDITSVEKHYQGLCSKIEQLQDSLEEAIERSKIG